MRALVVALLLSCAVAHAEDAHALLKRGVELQREASWSASVTQLERARATGSLSAPERADCAFHLAAAYLALGSESAARRELGLVLDANPSFEPPQFTSPKVASLLGDVARQRAAAPELEPRPPRKSGDHLELDFEAHRTPSPIYGIVRFRMRGDRDFADAPLVAREGGSGVGVVAEVQPPHGGVLEYYADALGPTGPLRAGSAERPLELPVPDSPRAPVREPRGPSKLLWLAIPAGVVIGTALGLGLYFGLRSRDHD